MSSMRHSIARHCAIAAIAMLGGAGIGNAAESPSTVVAKQGNAIVTLTDVDAFANGIPKEQRAGFFDDPTRLENLIANLLLKKQLAAEARAAGLDHDPDVQAQVAAAEDDALSKVRMMRFKSEIKVPDLTQLAKETYLGNKAKYLVPGKLDVKHVLISTKERSVAEARAIAEKVEKEAVAQPDKFDELVEKYSEDPSKGGNHGLMTNAGGDQYAPAFARAARELKKTGDISPVVETSYGFHVIKLVERTADRQQDFAEVREQITQRLRTDYIDKAIRGHTDGLRNLPIDANPELVASLRSRYGDLAAPPKPAPPAAKK